jgi:hypothetical protein
VNVGKTPAKNVTIRVFVVLLRASQEPPLEWVDHTDAHPHQRLDAGILFPNGVFRPSAYRIADGGYPVFASGDEEIAVEGGKSYVVTFGTIAYDDVFMVRHTTKFCAWDTAHVGFDSTGFNTLNCAHFNDGN